jgi:hypothetical protein
VTGIMKDSLDLESRFTSLYERIISGAFIISLTFFNDDKIG